MPSRLLDDLDPDFRPSVAELFARAAEAGIPLMIICILRSHEEQLADIASGHSWVDVSKHEANFRGKSEAIDVCPYVTFNLHGANKLQWDSSDPVWQTLGNIGKKLGLRWGGDWAQKDWGHFELVRAQRPSLRVAL